jgi:MFS family permease
VSLDSTTTQTFWIGSSYLLVSAVVQPFIVNLSDIFGRRPVLLSSIGIFTIGTILCCVTDDFVVFITGRCIQGTGGGGSFALVSVILADIIPLRQRAQYQAITSLAWSFAVITGMPVSLSLLPFQNLSSKHNCSPSYFLPCCFFGSNLKLENSDTQQALSLADCFLNTQHGDGAFISTSPSACLHSS